MKNGNPERQATTFKLPDKRIFNLQSRETGEIPVGRPELYAASRITLHEACQILKVFVGKI
jgi:hypothetical protein